MDLWVANWNSFMLLHYNCFQQLFSQVLTEHTSYIVHSRAKFLSFGNHGNCTECCLPTRGLVRQYWGWDCVYMQKLKEKPLRYPSSFSVTPQNDKGFVNFAWISFHFVVILFITKILFSALYSNTLTIWWNTLQCLYTFFY